MIGTQFGPFQMLRLLGAGGMGSVYLAEHSLMKDLHAIKVLDPSLTQNPQIVTRFVNEARAAARLRHRNLVRVHNIERLPDDGPWFMVLDYLDGRTLARFLAGHRGPVAPHLIVHILAQVANCIQHVHDHRIVHRDLKPDNIFLIQRDDDLHFPVVLDLGVAQLNEELASGPATKTGTVIGTPIYMAPEQLRGERVSPAADVFALGVIAYEMTTGGFYPYQFDEPRSGYFELPATEIYYRQRSAAPCDPRRRCPGLDSAWVDALRAALELEPRARPRSARDFALMLADAVPAGDGHPDGREIVRQVARELVQPRAEHDSGAARTVDASRPTHTVAAAATAAPAGPVGPAGLPDQADMQKPMSERTTLTEPISTLDGAASQSLAGGRAAQRWAKIAGSAVAALVVGALGSFAVIRWTTGGDDRVVTASSAPAARMAAPSSAPLVVPSAARSSDGAAGAATQPATEEQAAAPRIAPAPTAPAHPAHPDGAPDEAKAEPKPAPGPADVRSAVATATAAAPTTAADRAAPTAPPAPTRAASQSAAPPPTEVPAGKAPTAAPTTAADRAASTTPPVPTRAASQSPTPPPPATPPRSSPPGGAGARPAPSAARKVGELAIIVRPWALIWLNGRSHGQTPFREKVAAGRYLVRIANDDAGKDESLMITVNPDETTTVQRTW